MYFLKRLFFLISIWIFSFQGISNQTSDIWASLGMVSFDTKFDPDWGIDIQIPRFGPLIKALEGKEIEVNGYIIPLTGKVEQSHFILSKSKKK